MLDVFGILFSSFIMFLVIFRAIKDDAALPWFTAPKPTDSSGLTLRPLRPDARADARPLTRGR